MIIYYFSIKVVPILKTKCTTRRRENKIEKNRKRLKTLCKTTNYKKPLTYTLKKHSKKH